MTENNSQLDVDYPLSEAAVSAYRRDGIIQLDDMFTGDDLRELRQAVVEAVAAESPGRDESAGPKGVYEKIFVQKVNLWRRHPAVARFVHSRRMANVAARLMGRPARLWHDQALFKEPREGAKTPWHQDAPYWPHADKNHQVTLWIALREATTENGCMSFIPGTQVENQLKPVPLGDPDANRMLFEMAPQYKGIKPAVHELAAGSCTFHNGLTFHYAGPNKSDGVREAFAIIYMPADTHYDGADHVVTTPMKLTPGELFDDQMFPILSDVAFE